jgi:hypothetical protein
MSDQARTPSRNVVDNINRWMKAKGIGQQALTERLTRIDQVHGTASESSKTWHRRSINRLLNQQRRINIDELYSIALALEVNVGMLLFPEVPDDAESDRFQIGGLPSVGEWEMAAMLAKPAEVMSRPRVGVEGWDSDGPLVWIRKPSAMVEAVEGLRRAYEEAHPGISIDEVRGGDVLKWAEDQGAEVTR